MAEERDYELDPLAVEQSAQLINEFGNELKRQQATAEAKQVDDETERQIQFFGYVVSQFHNYLSPKYLSRRF